MKHDQAIELLPWYVNGTLSQEEQSSVEQHVNHCEACARELAEYSAVSDAAADQAEETPEVPEGLFARVLEDIDALEAEKRPTARAAASPGLLAAAGLALKEWWLPLSMPTRLALAGQALALVVVIGLLATPRPPSDVLQTASGPNPVEVSKQGRLVVGFHENVTEPEMRALLDEIGAQIVGGPSSIGLYTIEVPAQEMDVPLEAIVDTLRGRSALVRFVEPRRSVEGGTP